MGRVYVLGVRIAAGPNFMQPECTGRIGSAVQVITKAAILFARRCDQRAQLGFENCLLAFPRPQNHDQRDCLFRQLDAGACASACLGSGRLAGLLLCSTLRHAGGDCIPNRAAQVMPSLTLVPIAPAADPQSHRESQPHSAARKTMSTGAGTSITCPVRVSTPVAGSILKTTMSL